MNQHVKGMNLISSPSTSPQDYVSCRVPAPDPPADQEAGGAAAEGLLQGRPHHPAPASPGGEDRRPVQEPHEEVSKGDRVNVCSLMQGFGLGLCN